MRDASGTCGDNIRAQVNVFACVSGLRVEGLSLIVMTVAGVACERSAGASRCHGLDVIRRAIDGGGALRSPIWMILIGCVARLTEAVRV